MGWTPQALDLIIMYEGKLRNSAKLRQDGDYGRLRSGSHYDEQDPKEGNLE